MWEYDGVSMIIRWLKNIFSETMDPLLIEFTLFVVGFKYSCILKLFIENWDGWWS